MHHACFPFDHPRLLFSYLSRHCLPHFYFTAYFNLYTVCMVLHGQTASTDHAEQKGTSNVRLAACNDYSLYIILCHWYWYSDHKPPIWFQDDDEGVVVLCRRQIDYTTKLTSHNIVHACAVIRQHSSAVCVGMAVVVLCCNTLEKWHYSCAGL